MHIFIKLPCTRTIARRINLIARCAGFVVTAGKMEHTDADGCVFSRNVRPGIISPGPLLITRIEWDPYSHLWAAARLCRLQMCTVGVRLLHPRALVQILIVWDLAMVSRRTAPVTRANRRAVRL